jgi:hypothetical protein
MTISSDRPSQGSDRLRVFRRRSFVWDIAQAIKRWHYARRRAAWRAETRNLLSKSKHMRV